MWVREAQASLTTASHSLQEYLEVQRQLAIQRLQEQEKERQMRLEQQKQTVQMRAQMPAFPLPYAQAGAAHPTLPVPIIGHRPPLTVGSALSLAPGCAHSWGCALPALRPNQLPCHLQPSRLSRGLSDAWCVYEPASPSHWPLPQHAWHNSR